MNNLTIDKFFNDWKDQLMNSEKQNQFYQELMQLAKYYRQLGADSEREKKDRYN